MLKKVIGYSFKLTSAVLAASLLASICLVSFHDRNHHQDSSHNCSICFTAQVLSASDHQPVVVQISHPELSVFASDIFSMFAFVKPTCLEQPVIHGPPSV